MVELSTVVSPFSDPSSIEEAVSSRAPVSCRIALSSDDVELHRALRHAVFVEEQRLFQGTDRDLHDDTADTLCVLGLCGAVACGAVRLYPLDEPGLWKGDRLAVLPPVRHLTLGGSPDPVCFPSNLSYLLSRLEFALTKTDCASSFRFCILQRQGEEGPVSVCSCSFLVREALS